MPSSVRRKLIAGNCKMNGLSGHLALAAEIRDGAADLPDGVDLLVYPPATLLMAIADAIKRVPICGRRADCHVKESGSHIGDISAEMRADAGGDCMHQDPLRRLREPLQRDGLHSAR